MNHCLAPTATQNNELIHRIQPYLGSRSRVGTDPVSTCPPVGYPNLGPSLPNWGSQVLNSVVGILGVHPGGNKATGTSGWAEKFNRLRGLKKDWNGYDAEPPAETAISNAERFVRVMETMGVPPTRVAPSVVGGVGVTRRLDDRKVYIEFYNDGTAHALFSDGGEPKTQPVSLIQPQMVTTVEALRIFLND